MKQAVVKPETASTLKVDRVSEKQEDNEDLVYPFGGWTDENKYNK